MRILLLAEGDPESAMGSGSGTPYSLARGLRALGHEVLTRDVDLRGTVRASTALRTWAPARRRWVAQYHVSSRAVAARSRNAVRAVKESGALDAVLQYGGTFDATSAGVPVYLFCDSNVLFSSREPMSWGSALTATGLADAVKAESELYRHARGIFTMSRYIADSFVEDFQLDRSRVIPVGAGPNVSPLELVAIQRSGPRRPTILFIGREFERKGGDLLARAFEGVRRVLPEARLLVVGPREKVALPDGAEFLGFLDRTSASDWPVLKRAFESATVFALPARHEPFGLVVLEAMYAGLPVVASRIGALKEMVDDGVSGLLVPPGDVEALEAALLSVLQDRDAADMGAYGRQRARSSYSWETVTGRIIDTMLLDHVGDKAPAAARS